MPHKKILVPPLLSESQFYIRLILAHYLLFHETIYEKIFALKFFYEIEDRISILQFKELKI